MFGYPKFRSLFKSQTPTLPFIRFFQSVSDGSLYQNPKSTQNSVAIFWDLDNKPPNSLPPYDAAVRLKLAASQFGTVRYTVAYANHHSFRYIPPAVQEQRRERKMLDRFETKGLIKPSEEYLCRVCGRKFNTNVKLVNHFKQLHEREQMKRLNRLESARGKRRVQLVAKFSMKMAKYKNASQGVLIPKVGYGLGDELKRAGFWVRMVDDKPQAADKALRNHMVEMMDHGQIGCLVLVSDDSDFVNVLREARLRCLRTVVVGDSDGGPLRRCADAGFSWREIVAGKAKKEAVSVIGRWKDRDILKRLEWTYRPEVKRREFDADDCEVDCEDGVIEDTDFDDGKSLAGKEDARHWWELDSDTEGTSVESIKQ